MSNLAVTTPCDWETRQSEREHSVEPVAKLNRLYVRGMLTRREYFEEMYRTLEDMGGPDIIR